MENDIRIDVKETKIFEKYIRRLEKDSRQWPWLRWIMIIASACLMASAIYIYWKLAKLQEITSSIFTIQGNEFKANEVELFVEGRLTNLHLELIILFKVFLYAILGAAGIAYSLINWNRHTKSGLMAKVFRKILSEETISEKATINEPLHWTAYSHR